jgi:hypothetical protein
MKQMGLHLWRRYFFALVLTQAAAFANPAFAHNGVKLEQDACVVKVGPVAVHFIGYQQKGEPEEFCEDIARTGPTVIALSPIEPKQRSDSYWIAPANASSNAEFDFRNLAVGVRLVKDVGEDKEKADIAAATQFYLPPKVPRNGTLTFEHDFKDAGHYVAVITVSDGKGNEWSSRFPFGVGLYTFWNEIEYILYAAAFLSLIAFLWFLTARRSAPELQTTKA